MNTALFLILPTTSHYTSCIPLAKELNRNGHEIIFAGTMSGRNIVESNNFVFLEFSYISTYKVSSLSNFFRSLLANLLDRQKGKDRYKEFNESLHHLYSLLERINPTVIFIDEHISHYYAYVKPKIANVCVINTKLPTGKNAGVPPLNSPYLPLNNSIFNKLICEALWSRIILRKLFNHTINQIAFLGLTTEAFHNKFIQESGKLIDYTIKSCFEDYDIVVNAPTIILLSEKFNFPWRKRNQFEFFYHSWNIDPIPMEDSLSETVRFYKGKRKIIYCGIGKLPGNSIDSYARFFVQLMTFAKSTKQYLFIFSTSVPQITNMLKGSGTPEHVLIYDHVAQQDLLQHVDIMITHGGLNSVKECIFNQVPMLAVSNPAHNHTDTLGNIARVVYHQIGLRCNINDSAELIQVKIKILANKESFKKKIAELKNKMDHDILPFENLGVFQGFNE